MTQITGVKMKHTATPNASAVWGLKVTAVTTSEIPTAAMVSRCAQKAARTNVRGPKLPAERFGIATALQCFIAEFRLPYRTAPSKFILG
jgi:hypothetical protein